MTLMNSILTAKHGQEFWPLETLLAQELFMKPLCSKELCTFSEDLMA